MTTYTGAKSAVQQLAGYLDTIPARFLQLTGEQLLHRPVPGKWSKQEILGHLVDSAINNLKRFTEIQYLPQPYTITPYQQDLLVQVNQYQQLPLDHLMLLWKTLNQQIVYVTDHISAEKLQYPVIIPCGGARTLEWLITDYVEHLEHHLNQVFINKVN